MSFVTLFKTSNHSHRDVQNIILSRKARTFHWSQLLRNWTDLVLTERVRGEQILRQPRGRDAEDGYVFITCSKLGLPAWAVGQNALLYMPRYTLYNVQTTYSVPRSQAKFV